MVSKLSSSIRETNWQASYRKILKLYALLSPFFSPRRESHVAPLLPIRAPDQENCCCSESKIIISLHFHHFSCVLIIILIPTHRRLPTIHIPPVQHRRRLRKPSRLWPTIGRQVGQLSTNAIRSAYLMLNINRKIKSVVWCFTSVLLLCKSFFIFSLWLTGYMKMPIHRDSVRGT